MNILTHENVLEAKKLDAGEVDEAEAEADYTENESLVVDKVFATFKIYPKLSWTHLQVSIGTSFKPSFWKPVVWDLIKQGKLKLDRIHATSPNGREMTYQVISLPE